MKKVSYNNRYGDNIIFEQIDNEIHMSGFNMEWIRVGYDDEKNITMVDPSGGPYLAISMNLGLYFNDKQNRIIESIEIKENKIIFKIK
jgi:hypothetical protein